MPYKDKEKAKEYFREFYMVHKDRWLTPEFKERFRNYSKEYEQRPERKQRKKERQREYFPKYRQQNIEKLRIYHREYQREYSRKIDILLGNRLRSMCRAVLQERQSIRTRELIGCSVGFLKNHLESQFKDGMTWENYGRNGWHIDHRIPVSWFRGMLHRPEWQRVVCHWTNLQPLWEVENIKKGNRYAA